MGPPGGPGAGDRRARADNLGGGGAALPAEGRGGAGGPDAPGREPGRPPVFPPEPPAAVPPGGWEKTFVVKLAELVTRAQRREEDPT